MRGVFESVVRDVRIGLRGLLREPWFTAMAVVTLALGIGANTAVFSAVWGVLIRPLPYEEPERVVQLFSYGIEQGFGFGTVSYPDMMDWRERSTSFEAVAVYDEYGPVLVEGGEPERVTGASVSASFFEVLRIRPVLGRFFQEEEDEPGSARVVVLSHGFWKARFGGDSSIVGRTISLSEIVYEVIGVAPEFEDPQLSGRDAGDVALWRVSPAYFGTAERSGRSFTGIARLASGVTVDRAEAELNRIMAALGEEYPEEDAKRAVVVRRVHDTMVASAKTPLLVLLAAGGLVLLVACANVANLALARATSREREVAMRAALGASWSRLLGQSLIQNLVLALVAGAFGVVLAFGGAAALRVLAADQIARVSNIGVDLRVLAFAAIVSLMSSLLFGLVPVLATLRQDLVSTLKDGGRTGLSPGRRRYQRGLIVLEVAMSIVLLVGAGLLLRSLAALQRVDPGVDAQGVLTLRYDPPPGRQVTAVTLNVLYDDLVGRLRSIPGVTAVGASNILPLSGDFNGMGFRIDALPAPRPGEDPSAETRVVTPGFLQAMGIPLVRGRGLEEGDHTEAPPVLVINQAMAAQYWPGEDPIGQRITLQGASREIVGIVANVHEFSLAELPVAGMYIPQAQAPEWIRLPVLLAVRTPGEPLAIAGDLRDALRQYDANAVLSAFEPMERIVDRTLGAPRFRTLLLGIFAAIALSLGTIGVYGVVSRTVLQRRAEIGIRLSLGADRRSVTGLVVRDSMRPVALGLAVGSAAALLLARGMASLLFGVTPADPATFAVVISLLAAVATAACWIPAQRAAGLDPVHVLRSV